MTMKFQIMVLGVVTPVVMQDTSVWRTLLPPSAGWIIGVLPHHYMVWHPRRQRLKTAGFKYYMMQHFNCTLVNLFIILDLEPTENSKFLYLYIIHTLECGS